MTERLILSHESFIKRWWARRFPEANPPTWSSAVTCADATDLLQKYEEYLKEWKRQL